MPVAEYVPFWGMHLFWWAFWIFAMVGVFGYNVPERSRVNSLDPKFILKRRLAKGEITEAEFSKLTALMISNEDSVQKLVTSEVSHSKSIGHPIVDGLSFSATWALLYTACAALFWIAPAGMMTAMSKLFHGMSFTEMAQTGTAFGFGDFISVLTLGAVYTFAAGGIWSLVHSFFLRQKAERTVVQLKKNLVFKTS